MRSSNRSRALISTSLALTLILAVAVAAPLIPSEAYQPEIANRALTPSLSHPFGADWLGRDMLKRCIVGLNLSLKIGLFTSLISVGIAVLLGTAAATGSRLADAVIAWFIDLFISMPHLVFMILISFLVGGGAKGIIFGVGLTHWPALARLVRAETLKVISEPYVAISRQCGKGNLYILRHHFIPAIAPQVVVGFVMLLPHVILHESALTFLGFGLSPHTPAVGIILFEGMENMSTGSWWLIVLPALMLIILVKAFENIGERARIMLNPTRAQE